MINRSFNSVVLHQWRGSYLLPTQNLLLRSSFVTSSSSSQPKVMKSLINDKTTIPKPPLTIQQIMIEKNKPPVKKIKHSTEILNIKENRIMKLVNLKSEDKFYLTVKALPSSEPTAVDGGGKKKEGKEKFVFIPKALTVNFTDDLQNLTFTYKKKEQYLYDTFLKGFKEASSGIEILHKKKLILKGLGFRVSVEPSTIDPKKRFLSFKLGFANTVEKEIPDFISDVKIKRNMLILESFHKSSLGDYAASIQRLKMPETYKEKGFYFAGQKKVLKQIKKK
jgi:ribosomal protein L6P/L9E